MKSRCLKKRIEKIIKENTLKNRLEYRDIINDGYFRHKTADFHSFEMYFDPQ